MRLELQAHGGRVNGLPVDTRCRRKANDPLASSPNSTATTVPGGGVAGPSRASLSAAMAPSVLPAQASQLSQSSAEPCVLPARLSQGRPSPVRCTARAFSGTAEPCALHGTARTRRESSRGDSCHHHTGWVRTLASALDRRWVRRLLGVCQSASQTDSNKLE